MGNILADTYETFAENIRLVLIFSIPFIIAFIIPLLAPLPTYVSMGGIFLRSASIFTNLDFYSIAVILLAFFFSLLFISFAFVAISLIVKSRKTRLKIGQRALRSIEKYTGRVFILFIIYAIIISNLLQFSISGSANVYVPTASGVNCAAYGPTGGGFV